MKATRPITRARTHASALAILATATAVALSIPAGADPAAAATGFRHGGPKEDGFSSTRCVARGKTVRSREKTRRKVVALTFDDGPSDATNRFLRVLRRYEAQATFFAVGQEIGGREKVLRRAVKQGHAVGNHTWSHADVSSGGSSARRQIRRTTKAIRRATDVRPCLFRPPYGRIGGGLVDVVRDEDMIAALWSTDTRDFEGISPAAIAARAIHGIERGGIILMHDGGGDQGNTLAALPAILREVRQRGYQAVSLPELFHLQKRN